MPVAAVVKRPPLMIIELAIEIARTPSPYPGILNLCIGVSPWQCWADGVKIDD